MSTELQGWVERNARTLDWRPFSGCKPFSGYMSLVRSGAVQASLSAIVLLLALSGGVALQWGLLCNFLIPPLALVAHLRGIKSFRQHHARVDLQDVLAGPPPAVYLRSFGADSEIFYQVHSSETRTEPGSVDYSNTWTVEEIAIGVVAKTCPVIAVGRPGDPMPPVGAARLYCSEESDWRQLVGGLLINSALVVLRPGNSEGVRWELQQVLASKHRNRCALLLVDSEGLPFDKKTYLQFRDLVAQTCSVDLPIAGWNAWLMYFDSQGRAQTVDAGTIDNPGRELARAVRTLLARHPAGEALAKAPRRRPSVRRMPCLLWEFLWPLALTVVLVIAGLQVTS